MNKIFVTALWIILILAFMVGCTSPSEEPAETMPFPSVTVDAKPTELPSDSVPQPDLPNDDSEEDLPVPDTAPVPDSSSEDLVVTTEPFQPEHTEPRVPESTEPKPEPSAEADGPTELDVIDEYVVNGEGAPAG